MVALVRQRRGVGAVVVAGDQQHAAVFGGAGKIHVFEYVAAAVDAWTFAVPHREHAVVFRFADQGDLLCTPHGGRSELLIDAGLKLDVMRVEMFARLPQRFVQPAQRRTAITGNKSRGVESRR